MRSSPDRLPIHDCGCQKFRLPSSVSDRTAVDRLQTAHSKKISDAMYSQPHLKRVIVIGGSIAGLLSAAALADFADEVIIVERDRIKANAAPRTGVPQSPQPHILLTRGYRILTDLFPSLDSDLLSAGAVPVDWGQDFHCFAFGGWNATQPESTEFQSFSCTRPLLENIVRQHVERISNVKRLSPYRVESLVGKAEAVTGVRYRNPKNKSEGAFFRQT